MTRFDLTETRRLRTARRTQSFHWLLRTLFGLGIVAAGFWTAYLVTTNGWTTIGAIAAGIEIGACILFGWIFIMTGSGADSLEMNEDGIELGFARGRIRRLRWSDATFGLNVFQTRGPEKNGSTVQWIEFGSGVWPVTNFLTVPAFDAILRGAQEHGLSVVARPLPRKGPTWYRIVQPSPDERPRGND